MGGVRYRFQAELRTRWRAWVGLALLVGIAGGVCLALVAGARRTDSSYTRLLDAERPYDVAVFEGGFAGDIEIPNFRRRVASLPEVAEAARFRSLHDNGGRTGDGRRIGEPDYLQTIVAEDAAAAAMLARQKVLDGRHPDPGEPGEVAVNFTVAEHYDLDVGERFELELFTGEQLQGFLDAGVPATPPFPGRRFPFRVTGTFASAGDFPPRSLGDGAGTVNFTPAFLAAHPEYAPMRALAVRLRPGSVSVRDFEEGVENIAADAAPFAELGNLTSRGIQHAATDRSIHLLAVALWVIAALAVGASLLVVGQALFRAASLGSFEYGTLRALGSSDAQLTAARSLVGAAVAVAGGAAALVLAVALSSLFPLGLARTAEPDPGLHLDRVAVLGGAALVAVVVASLGVGAAWRATRSSRPAASRRAESVSAAGTALARSGLPVPASTGIRMALERGRGATIVPARSTITGSVIAVAALAGAITFGAGLGHLLDSPRLFGWNWDVTVGDGYGVDAYDDVVPALRAQPSVDGIAAGTFAALDVEGREVFILATDPVLGTVAPTVVDGRVPSAPDEIALGRTTMDETDVSIGDRVRVRYLGTFNGEARVTPPEPRVRVVGEAVLPEQSDIGLDDAGAMTYEGLLALTGRGERPHRNFFPVRFADDVDSQRAFARLTRSVELYTVPTQRPTDLVNFGRVEALPILGAGMVTLIAVAMLVHLLLSSVRRRRRDLALLKTLGFTSRQVASAVAWQASTLVVVALIVGIPLGVATGRWAWSRTAEELGVVVQPVVPVLALLALVPIAVLIANVVAWIPAWMAGRTRPAAVLRSE